MAACRRVFTALLCCMATTTAAATDQRSRVGLRVLQADGSLTQNSPNNTQNDPVSPPVEHKPCLPPSIRPAVQARVAAVLERMKKLDANIACVNEGLECIGRSLDTYIQHAKDSGAVAARLSQAEDLRKTLDDLQALASRGSTKPCATEPIDDDHSVRFMHAETAPLAAAVPGPSTAVSSLRRSSQSTKHQNGKNAKQSRHVSVWSKRLWALSLVAMSVVLASSLFCFLSSFFTTFERDPQLLAPYKITHAQNQRQQQHHEKDSEHA